MEASSSSPRVIGFVSVATPLSAGMKERMKRADKRREREKKRQQFRPPSLSTSTSKPLFLNNKKITSVALAHALQAHLSAEGAAAEDAGTFPAFDPSIRITCAAAAMPSMPASSAVSAAVAAPASVSSSPKAIVGGNEDETTTTTTTAAAAAAASNGEGGGQPKKKKTSIFGKLLKKIPSGGGGSSSGNGGGGGTAAGGPGGAGATNPLVLVSGGKAAAEPALAAGATWIPTLDGVAAECDVVLCCLPGDGPLEAAARAVVAANSAAAAAAAKASSGPNQRRRCCFVALGPASRDALLATGKLLLLSQGSPFDFAAVHLTGDADAVRRGALLAHVAGPKHKGEEGEGEQEAEKNNNPTSSSSTSTSTPPPSAAATAELLLEPLCREVLFLSREPAVAGDVAGVAAGAGGTDVTAAARGAALGR